MIWYEYFCISFSYSRICLPHLYVLLCIEHVIFFFQEAYGSWKDLHLRRVVCVHRLTLTVVGIAGALHIESTAVAEFGIYSVIPLDVSVALRPIIPIAHEGRVANSSNRISVGISTV